MREGSQVREGRVLPRPVHMPDDSNHRSEPLQWVRGLLFCGSLQLSTRVLCYGPGGTTAWYLLGKQLPANQLSQLTTIGRHLT